MIVPVIGKTPGRRYGHAIIFNKPYLLVFGGNSGSSSEIMIAGAQDAGFALSPSENSLETRCLAMTSRASGLSSIVPGTRNFA